MNETVKERLVAYLEHKGINKSEFGRMIGVSNAYISSIRKSIQPDKVERISVAFPDLNVSWLVTGEGDMLNENKNDVAMLKERVSATTLDKALDEIAAMRCLLEKAIQNNKEQADRFFAIIERMQGV